MNEFLRVLLFPHITALTVDFIGVTKVLRIVALSWRQLKITKHFHPLMEPIIIELVAQRLVLH
jgi:hypothetical protein